MSERHSNPLDGHRVEELLIDLHIGRITDEDRREIETMLDADPMFGPISDAIGRSLRPLDHWTAAAMPEDLIEKTLSRIEREKTQDVVDPFPPLEERPWRPFGSFRFPLRNLLGVAASIALLLGALVPALAEVRHRSQKSRCASNLGSIFQGAKLYQASFAGALPFAGDQENAAWLPPTRPGDRPYASNSRHMFLLAKYNFGPSTSSFVCPSAADGEAMPTEELAAHGDFLSMKNISYDSLNLSGSHPNLRPIVTMAYASDRNPLFRSGRFDRTINPLRANSRAHGNRGQCVLGLDGAVRWITSPFFGKSRDNIWLAGNIRSYDGSERPCRPDDTQLVPGVPASDPKVRALLAQ